tara:strand:- start:5971 stop:6363 length:393 start_codon:yes stop_codon:yes gene_type:complete
MPKKEVFSVYILTAISLMALIPLIFSGNFTSFFCYVLDNNKKVDVYIFSDKLRFAENIAYDIIEMATISILIWTIKTLVENIIVKKYIQCFLTISLVNLAFYFINYNAYSSFYTLPLLAAMLYLVRLRNK